MDARANTKMAIIHIGCALIGIVAQTKTAIAITEKGKTMRLIDADALKTIRSIQSADYNSIETIQHWIDTAPTIDAVPVVRCKDCEWYVRSMIKQDGTLDERYKPERKLRKFREQETKRRKDNPSTGE